MLAICGRIIDWSATGVMLSGIGTVGGAIAVLIAAWVGSNTFSRWRRQKLEERKIDLAEQVLALAYKAEDAIEQIRFPSYDGFERDRAFANMKASGAVDDNTPLEEQSRLLTPQVTIDRLIEGKAIWTELAEVTPVSRAIFGAGIADQLAVLRTQRGRIQAAALGLADLARRYPGEDRPEVLQRMDERRDRYEAVIWSGAEEPDDFKATVSAAVAEIDSALGAVIRLRR